MDRRRRCDEVEAFVDADTEPEVHVEIRAEPWLQVAFDPECRDTNVEMNRLVGLPGVRLVKNQVEFRSLCGEDRSRVAVGVEEPERHRVHDLGGELGRVRQRLDRAEQASIRSYLLQEV